MNEQITELRERLYGAANHFDSMRGQLPTDWQDFAIEHANELRHVIGELTAIAALGQGEAEPFAFVDCEGSKVTSCAELVWPRNVSRGKRGAKAAWRELPPGLHPLYLHPATKPVVPDGFVMVPREPTDTQVREAVYNTNRKYSHNPVDDVIVRAVWSTMLWARPILAAAPTPEAQPQGDMTRMLQCPQCPTGVETSATGDVACIRCGATMEPDATAKPHSARPDMYRYMDSSPKLTPLVGEAGQGVDGEEDYVVDFADRAVELAERLVASGPKASHVSASECHEISEWVIAAARRIATHTQEGRG